MTADQDPEQLFAAWADRAEGDAAPDFEQFVAAHPQHDEALRRMHADWRLFAPILERVVPGLMASDTGVGPLPAAPPDGDAAAPVSSDLIERLGIRLPDSGRYRFRAVLGRGGGGVVLKVWDQKLHRSLAMKVVLGRGEVQPGGDTPRVDAAVMTRFVDEARIASQLDHPGIVPVHELGTDASGRAFFTMRLVRGEDLSRIYQRVRDGSDGWTLVRALGVLAKVCEAVAYAHGKHVVHRDLKPANVMVGRHGEVHVMDWGLARVAGTRDPRPDAEAALASRIDTLRAAEREATPGSPLLTLDGSAVGTPAYMAPEQARGELASVDARSDVYAIGAMLYELLAGSPPFVPAGARLDPRLVLLRVVEGPPVPLETAAPQAPPELVAICERAMDRDPARRYQDVRALEADLRAFLELRVVAAYEGGTWAEARKWLRRNRGLAAAAAAAVLATAAGAVLFAWKAAEATEQALVAQAHESAVRDANAESRRLLAAASVDAMHQADRLLVAAPASTPVAWHRSLVEGLFQLVRSIETDPGNGPAWERLGNELAAIAQPLAPSVLLEVGSEVVGAVWSPDGTRVLTTSDPGDPIVWDAATGQRLFALPVGTTELASWSTDGVRLLTVATGDVRVWDARGGQLLAKLPHPRAVNTAVFSRGSARVLTGGKDGRIRIWDAASGTLLQTLEEDSAIEGLSCNADGSVIAVDREGLANRIWIDSGAGHAPRGPFQDAGGGSLRILAVHGRHAFLEGGLFDGTVLHRMSLDGSEVVAFGQASSTAFVTRTGRAVAQLADGYVAFELRDGAAHTAWTLPVGDEEAFDHFSDDGLQVAHFGDGGRITVFHAFATQAPMHLVQPGAFGAAFSPDGGRLLVYDASGSVGLWTLHDRRSPSSERLLAATTAHATGDNQKLVLVAPDEPRLEVCWLASARSTSLLPRPRQSVRPEGTIRLPGDGFVVGDELIRVTPAGELQRQQLPPTDTPRARSSFSAAGDLVVTTQGRTATVWADRGGTQVATLMHEHPLHHALLTPDGTRVVTATERGEGLVWHVGTQRVERRLEGDYRPEVARANAAGNRVAAAHDRLTVWNLDLGTRCGAVDFEDCFVWLPDGSRILVQDTRQVAVWNDTLTERLLVLTEPDTFLGTFEAADAFGLQGRLVIGGEGVSVWDIPSGTRLAHFVHPDSTRARATFAADGRHIVRFHYERGSGIYRYARLTDLGHGIDLRAAATPELVPGVHALVRLATGRVRGTDGRLRPASAAETSATRSQVRELAAAGGAGAVLARHFLDDSPAGTVEPGGQRTRREHADELLDLGEPELAMRLDPSHPLVRTALSAERPALAGLRDGDLARLPDDARLWARAARMLDAMDDRERSRAAAQRALQLSPGDEVALRVAAVDTAEAAIDRALAAGPTRTSAVAALQTDPSLDRIARVVAVERLARRTAEVKAWLDDLEHACPLVAAMAEAAAAAIERPAWQRAFARELLAGWREHADLLNSHAWGVVWRQSAPTPQELDLGLRSARRAAELAPDDLNIANTLGVAEYRCGQYEAALVALQRSDRGRIANGVRRAPEDVAFLAMALAKLGRADEARAELRALEALVGKAPEGDDARYLAEARAVVGN